MPRQQLNLDFPKPLPTSLRPAFSYISCNSNPSSNHKAPRYSFLSIFLTRYTWQRKFQTVLSSAERSGTETLLTAVFKRLIWWYLTLISEKNSCCKLKKRERKLKNLNRGFLGLWIDSGAENFCIKDCVEPFGWNQFSFSLGKLINLLTVSHCFHFSSSLLYLFESCYVAFFWNLSLSNSSLKQSDCVLSLSLVNLRLTNLSFTKKKKISHN